MLTQVKTVETIEEARKAVEDFHKGGYLRENTYVLTHEANHTDLVSKVTNTSRIGLVEEGVFTAVANLFRSRGDELRAKMRSMGISKEHADDLEAQLDEGKIVIIAFGGNLNFDADGVDPKILYHPYLTATQSGGIFRPK